jgi:hypothetical protein
VTFRLIYPRYLVLCKIYGEKIGGENQLCPLYYLPLLFIFNKEVEESLISSSFTMGHKASTISIVDVSVT